MCAVGDENQSIYGWREADIRNIQDFKIDYPEAKIIYMEQNYRSTKNILGAADLLIAHNYEHMSKEQRPWTDDRKGQKVKYVAMTRAEDMLFLTGAFECFVYGTPETNPISEFIKEISPKYMQQLVPTRNKTL